MVAATGIAPEGDSAACRWAAVRHADDHIHIVATVVREDGRQARIRQDGARSQTEARKVEIDYGLGRLNVGDGTAAKRPTSAERHKADRQGKERTPARSCARPYAAPRPESPARRSSSTAWPPPAS